MRTNRKGGFGRFSNAFSFNNYTNPKITTQLNSAISAKPTPSFNYTKPSKPSRPSKQPEKGRPKHKTNVRTRLKALIRYYGQKIVGSFSSLTSSTKIRPDAKRNIRNALSDLLLAMKYLTSHGDVTEKTYESFKERMKEVSQFIQRLASVGWHAGEYIRKYGFDDVFFPENEFINSSDTAEAIRRATSYLMGAL